MLRTVNSTTAETAVAVDHPPQLDGLDVPYVAFGYRPTLFDAPATTDADIEWDAHTLLVAAPDAVMTRHIGVVCGLAWGYRVSDHHPTVTPLTVLDGPDSWADDLTVLQTHHPTWTFYPTGPGPTPPPPP